MYLYSIGIGEKNLHHPIHLVTFYAEFWIRIHFKLIQIQPRTSRLVKIKWGSDCRAKCKCRLGSGLLINVIKYRTSNKQEMATFPLNFSLQRYSMLLYSAMDDWPFLLKIILTDALLFVKFTIGSVSTSPNMDPDLPDLTGKFNTGSRESRSKTQIL
jgi:hypothetical protein